MATLNHRQQLYTLQWSLLLLVASFAFRSFSSSCCRLPKTDPISHSQGHTHWTNVQSPRSAIVQVHQFRPHGHMHPPSSPSTLFFSVFLLFSSSSSPSVFTCFFLAKVAHPDSDGHSQRQSQHQKQQ